MDRELIGQSHTQDKSKDTAIYTQHTIFLWDTVGSIATGLREGIFMTGLTKRNHFTFGGHSSYFIYSID